MSVEKKQEQFLRQAEIASFTTTVKSGWPWTIAYDVTAYTRRNQWPKISVVVPSYNQAQFLEETLRSVILQNYPNLELIVMDGGSTDSSVEIIKHYAPFIDYWVSEKDGGQSAALNKGLQMATGEFFAWQNSDDIYYPGAFRELVLNGDHADVVYSSVDAIDDRSGFMYRLYYYPFSHYVLKYKGIVFSNQAAIFRKSVIEKIGFQESLHYAMDLELQFRLAKAGARFRYIKGIYGGYRFHAGAKTVAEWEGKSRQESLQIRKSHIPGININIPFNQQYRLQRTISMFIIGWYKLFNGGFMYKLKQFIKPDQKPV